MFQPFSPDSIFPLLCPVREYEWIDVWQCEMLRSKSGINEKGCIFRTNFENFGGPEIWVTSCYEPNKRIEFVRTSPALVTFYEIELRPVNGGTELVWTEQITTLNEEGNLLLEKHNSQQYNEMIKSLETMLNTYLSTQNKDKPTSQCTP